MDIASRYPAGYLGEDVRLTTTMVFALDGCDDPDLMDSLAAIVDDSGAPGRGALGRSSQSSRRLPRTGCSDIVERMNLPSQDPEFGSAVATALSTATHRGQVDLQSLLDWLDTLDFRDSGGFSGDSQVVELRRSWQPGPTTSTCPVDVVDGWREAGWDKQRNCSHGTTPTSEPSRSTSAAASRPRSCAYPDTYTAHHLGREKPWPPTTGSGGYLS